MYRSIITGSGAYIPETVVTNDDFLKSAFHAEDGTLLDRPSAEIIEKFSMITGIRERRYAGPELLASDMAALAAELALAESGSDKESIDQLIVAHNFGDIDPVLLKTGLVPSLASKVKKMLGITNPACTPYDLIFGCPGWLQGMIQADAFFKAGIARKALVIGTETLSRVIDRHDRDSMIFSDGAGACVLEYREVNDERVGMLSANVRSDCGEELDYIDLGITHNPQAEEDRQYIKMKGRKVYEYALRHVASAMKECLDAAGFGIHELKTIFIHQANEKMDEAIVRKLFGLYGITDIPTNVLPMCIQWLGNSSVATIPTLYDLVSKGTMEGYRLDRGDIILFASVGAGMNINAVCYGCQ